MELISLIFTENPLYLLIDPMLRHRLKNKTTFIVGNKKNSGKTTYLNMALGRLRGKGRLAYLSIGVDGEMSDQIFGFAKPRVHAMPGDYVVTLDHALSYTRARFKVLKTFPFKTVLGYPKLVKITSSGDIEIIGPDNNAQLGEILNYLRRRVRIKTILIDGAINRLTQVASFCEAQFVFVCRVDPERVASAAEELKRMWMLSKMDRHSDNALFILGPLTTAKALKIKPTVKKVVVEDLTKVFLNYRELVKFQRRHVLCLKRGFKLAGMVVNLFGVERPAFLKCLADKKLAARIRMNDCR